MKICITWHCKSFNLVRLPLGHAVVDFHSGSPVEDFSMPLKMLSWLLLYMSLLSGVALSEVSSIVFPLLKELIFQCCKFFLTWIDGQRMSFTVIRKPTEAVWLGFWPVQIKLIWSQYGQIFMLQQAFLDWGSVWRRRRRCDPRICTGPLNGFCIRSSSFISPHRHGPMCYRWLPTFNGFVYKVNRYTTLSAISTTLMTSHCG